MIVILVVALGFPLGFCDRKIDFTSEPNVFVTYTGFPFETAKIKKTVDFDLAWSSDDPLQILDKHVQGDNSATGYPPWDPEQGLCAEFLVIREEPEYLWVGIVLNTILITIFSIVIAKLATWIYDEIGYRRFTGRTRNTNIL